MKKSWLYKKTVIISGASGGIGFNVAKLLIENYDCNVIGICRNETKILDAISTLGEKKVNFSYYIFDVSIKENWIDFAQKLNKNGTIPDILINNAGFMLPFLKFEKLPDEDIEEIVKTDLLSVIYGTKYIMPLLKKSSTPAIYNVSSAAGLCPVVGESLYCTVKFAVRGFTETLYQEYKKDFVIGGIYPGFIRTNILHRMSIKDKENKLIQKLMMPIDKASKKIVKGILRKKKKIVMGFDGRFMSTSRIFENINPYLITTVLKKSKLELFEEVFDNKK